MAASAMEEPVTPLISVDSAMEVWASPPCMRPVRTEASLSRLWVMPELFMKFPARMNSGIASSAKFCVSVTVSWIGMVKGSSGCCRKNTVPEMPMANATGIPRSSRTVNTTRTVSIGRSGRGEAAREASQDVRRPAFGVLAAQLGPDLQQRGYQEQQGADRQAHRHPGVAHLRNPLEAANPADPRQVEPHPDEIGQKHRDDGVVQHPACRLQVRRKP